MNKAELFNEIKAYLVNTEVIEDDYIINLNKFLNNLDCELDQTFSDYDRIYTKDYVYNDWEECYICSIDKEFITRQLLDSDGVVYEEDIIKIIDIFIKK